MVRVSVIGCGVLGTKIAGALAYNGHEVRAYDSDSNTLNKLQLKIGEDKRILKEDGFFVGTNFVGEVYCFSSIEDAVRGSVFIIESIIENLEMKKSLFKTISTHCSSDAILSTSSLRLSIDEIFEDIDIKERCLGLRFLYPVYFIPEVELLPGKNTSLETLEKVRKFLDRMGKIAFFRSGKEPIVLNDEQRELRKDAYIRQLNEKKDLLRRIDYPIPNLGGSFYETEKELSDQYGSKETECVICMDNNRDCVLYPCHHLCTCIDCGKLLLKRHDSCPICRRLINDAFRVYHS